MLLAPVYPALPRTIGSLRSGEPVVSGIAKRPVATDALALDSLRLEGGRQADQTVHGGPDKAVPAYPAEHLPRWNEELVATKRQQELGEVRIKKDVRPEQRIAADRRSAGHRGAGSPSSTCA